MNPNTILDFLKKFSFKKKKVNNEDDPLAGLKSYDERKKEKKSAIYKKVAALVILIPLVFSIVQILIKTGFILATQEDETVITKKIPREKLSFKINTFTKWQDLKDAKDKELTNQISTLKDDLTLDIKKSESATAKHIQDVQTTIINEINASNKASNELITKMYKQLDLDKKSNKERLKKNIEDLETKMERDLKQIKIISQQTPLLSLPELPPLRQLKNNNKKIKQERVLTTSVTSTKNSNSNANSNKEDIKSAPIVYEIIEESIESTKFEVSTLEKYTKKIKEKKKKLPSFTLMPGFVKAIIVAGADVPTMAGKASEPKPIWLSINSEELIANNEVLHFEDCMVQATASGDLVSGRAHLRLSKISCSMTDLDGIKYKINTGIKGWVYGEEGKYGVKGRLVSKEGEIISKGVPLAAIESIIGALSQPDQSFIMPGGTTENSVSSNIATSGAKTSSKILGKFAEYYLQILENMNPYIEIRAKRRVTIAFAGGEMLTPVEYTPMDVNYFENIEYEEESK